MFLRLKRPNVLLDQQKGKAAALRQAQQQQQQQRNSSPQGSASESESEEEPEGEDVFSDAGADTDGDQNMDEVHAGAAKSASGKAKSKRGRNERVMPAEECRAHLRRLFANEPVMCSLLYGRHGPFAPMTANKLSLASAEMFFLEVIPVSPTRFRPPAKMGEMLFEHPQNELLAKILNTSYRLRDLTENLKKASMKSPDHEVDEMQRRKILQSLLDTLIQLQVDVNSFIDSSKNPAPVRQGKLPPAGVKQNLEKKEGLFRKNMMVRQRQYYSPPRTPS